MPLRFDRVKSAVSFRIKVGVYVGRQRERRNYHSGSSVFQREPFMNLIEIDAVKERKLLIMCTEFKEDCYQNSECQLSAVPLRVP